jgi:hypothetical protein
MNRRPALILATLTATAAILTSCATGPYGTCQPRYQGTADQYDDNNNLTCIWWGNENPEDPPGPATWVEDPIAGGLHAMSARCEGTSPVFNVYGNQPPGTPEARTCVIRYYP